MTREERIKSLNDTITVLEKLVHELEMEQQTEEWYKEADELKKEFPDFDLRKEIKSRDFCTWLIDGVSVRVAYLKTHKGDKPCAC